MNREDLIETMAESIWIASNTICRYKSGMIAVAVLAAIEAAGCAVVPVVATEEMLSAAEYPLCGVACGDLAFDIAGDTYVAMLAASPHLTETK